MKLSKVSFLFTILAAFLLSSCIGATTQSNIQQAILLVETASRRTAELHNGKFTFQSVKEAPSERHEETMVNVFQNNSGTYDWHNVLTSGYSPSFRKNMTERIQKEQVQYLRIGLINQEGLFIGEDGILLPEEPVWEKVAENVADPPPNLALLTNMDLKEDDIETVEIKKDAGNTTCTFTYSQEYLSDQMQVHVKEAENNLMWAKKEQADLQLIHSLEQAVSHQKSLDYTEAQLSFTVNDAGFLVGYRLNRSFEYLVSDIAYVLKSRDSLELLDYNFPELEVPLPKG